MADQGPICVHCRRAPARHHYEGVPTCATCELGLRTVSEPKRLCPVDGATMAKRAVHGILVDQCTHCGGVWLDPGELELIGKSDASSSADLLRALAPDEAPR